MSAVALRPAAIEPVCPAAEPCQSPLCRALTRCSFEASPLAHAAAPRFFGIDPAPSHDTHVVSFWRRIIRNNGTVFRLIGAVATSNSNPPRVTLTLCDEVEGS